MRQNMHNTPDTVLLLRISLPSHIGTVCKHRNARYTKLGSTDHWLFSCSASWGAPYCKNGQQTEHGRSSSRHSSGGRGSRPRACCSSSRPAQQQWSAVCERRCGATVPRSASQHMNHKINFRGSKACPLHAGYLTWLERRRHWTQKPPDFKRTAKKRAHS